MESLVLDLLKESTALMDGHFLLSSGRHSDRYCQSALLLQHPEKAAKAFEAVAKEASKLAIDIVVGPAIGGIVPAYELARQLGVAGIFTERENNVVSLRRGFHIKPGARVLIAEDVITTGKSTLETANAITDAGGVVIAVACLADRGESHLPFPTIAGTKLVIQSWAADECPLCKQGILLVKPGSRKAT